VSATLPPWRHAPTTAVLPRAAGLLLLPAAALVLAAAAMVLWLNEPAAQPAVTVLQLSAPDEDTALAALSGAAMSRTEEATAPGAGSTRPLQAAPAPAARAVHDAAATQVAAAPTPAQLSPNRPLAARAFLDAVQLAPHPRGGWQVLGVEPGSRPARLGLQPGDRLYSLDTPLTANLEETSMVALMLQTRLELDIFRAGQPIRLQLALNRDDPDDDDARTDAQR